MNKFGVLKDTILNMIGFAIPIGVLQLLVLPRIALTLGVERYGIAVSIISFYSLVSVPLGSVLNNVKLLLDKKYNENHLEGDFRVILLIHILLNIIVMFIGGIYFSNDIFGILLIIIFSILNVIKEYYVVTYRLNLNYKKILMKNFFLGIGYLLGLLIFFKIGYWQFVYLIGNLLSCIYILKDNPLFYESIKITYLFKSTVYSVLILLASMFLNMSLNYADKLILYPLLGPTAVSIYYSSTIIGKIIAMLISPLSNVVLSHLVNLKSISKKTFKKLIFILIILAIASYIVIMIFSPFFVKILYPDWYEESVKLLPITNLMAILMAITGIVNTIILRFKEMKWQFNINILTLIMYLIFSLIFYNFWGLVGFTFGITLSYIIKFIITVFIFYLD